MPAQVICLASAKGGSGKTVLTATFTQLLVALGKRVLLIDTDAATNGLSLLYLHQVVEHREGLGPEERPPTGMFDHWEGQEMSPVAHGASPVTLEGGADLIPATYSFASTEDVSIGEYKRRLGLALNAFAADYDYILLDAQAGSDGVAQIAMSRAVSSSVVLVCEYDPLSAAGIDRLKGMLADDLTYERTWILINKMLPEFATSLGKFLEVARYLSPIPWDADVVRAYARRTLALDLERGNDYTLAVLQTLKGLVGPEVEREIDDWIRSKAAMLREPVELQMTDLEMEQNGLIIERAQLERRQQRRRIMTTVGAGYAVVGVGAGLYLLAASVVVAGAIVVALATLLAVAGMLLALQRGSNVEIKVADVQLRRQEGILEERLKTLQALREAEPEEFIRRGAGS